MVWVRNLAGFGPAAEKKIIINNRDKKMHNVLVKTDQESRIIVKAAEKKRISYSILTQH